MITFVQETLKSQYHVEGVTQTRIIYRGFVLDPSKTIAEVENGRYCYP